MPCKSSVLEVNAVIEAGTRSRFSDRFSAVTTISVSAVSSTAAASAALAGAMCRFASTARVSADAPLNELALIVTARPACDRIPRLPIFEDMLFPPSLALFRRFLMYLEPTETVAQAPRFARHLVDKRRHALDLTARETQLH